MDITTEMVKELRERTGAGVLDSKRALQDTQGDMDRAVLLIREKGLARADKKAGRKAWQGLIETYTHAGGRIGVMAEVNCETDFVARTPDFKMLAHDIALQIAGTNPRFVDSADVPADVVEAQRAAYRVQLAHEQQPAHAVEQLIEDKLRKFYEEACLMNQPFIRDPNLTVSDLIKQAIATLGENIRVRRFARFELGE